VLALNFVAFQLGWFACVLGAARNLPWLGPVVVTLIVLVTGWFAPRRDSFLLLLGLSGAVGLCWDSALAASGLIAYAPGPITPPLAPLWILALWLLFASTFNLSMRWLQSRMLLAAALGAVAAPLSYLAGERLGALRLLRPEGALLAQAVGWALMMPVLLSFARRLNARA
jgi:hypothetical protein